MHSGFDSFLFGEQRLEEMEGLRHRAIHVKCTQRGWKLRVAHLLGILLLCSMREESHKFPPTDFWSGHCFSHVWIYHIAVGSKWCGSPFSLLSLQPPLPMTMQASRILSIWKILAEGGFFIQPTQEMTVGKIITAIIILDGGVGFLTTSRISPATWTKAIFCSSIMATRARGTCTHPRRPCYEFATGHWMGFPFRIANLLEKKSLCVFRRYSTVSWFAHHPIFHESLWLTSKHLHPANQQICSISVRTSSWRFVQCDKSDKQFISAWCAKIREIHILCHR